ncbi:DUF292-domain-containing protein [Violaceomyces palustris]|uniref:DUF292-domain-containing protein n=1 Tax=Violaceomyces palustris TaxID=1673888 RepID=A0ACD0P120_9BASI|nr:DUF292-domain-containing protein [Violaceomyces palustris]
MVPWNSARTKVQLKLAVQRTKMLQEKKEAMAKRARREIATLVEKGKIETARIKTEGIIAEDIHIELLELMELYSEMLLARFALLDMNTREPEPSLLPAISSIIHASPRTELKELHVLREMLMSKYGRDFSLDCMENKDGCVPERVISKLRVETAPGTLVDAYISEICRSYDVPFQSDLVAGEGVEVSDGGNDSGTDQGGPGVAEKIKEAAEESIQTKTKGEDKDPVVAAAEPKGNVVEKPKGGGSNKANGEDALSDLEARFAALKKRV